MSAMKRILELMVDKHASDVYLSATAVALIKINGTSVSFNNQVLGATTPLNLLTEIVSSADIEELKETGELNMGVALPGVGRFRISAMRQRGTIAAVVRFIDSEIPSLDTLNLPPIVGSLVMERGDFAVDETHHGGNGAALAHGADTEAPDA